MATSISRLSEVHPSAEIGENVQIGPFCVVGPKVVVGDDCILDSHVALVGRTTIGRGNRFWPNSVIGGEPQDKSYVEGETQVVIGDNNQFREGVTVHRGAEKEDGITRIGDRNLLMANAHVAHNCRLYDDTIIVNGVLLGGHVHVHDRAVISGNSVIHHFGSVGTCAMIGGGSRVTIDVAPYMLAFGSDQVTMLNINVVGMQRAGVSAESIAVIKQAHRLLFRQKKALKEVREHFSAQLAGQLPPELVHLLDFIARQAEGKMGRQREAFRNAPTTAKAA
ncbi:Acyl-[acyl-carrier-protein]--UDP-N-acetylglucosamine O-acyltransferase [Caulifigura coniformis]|uniref:Acyl-[acyl-carrier-protein]--UDP-N-acetylglucosamine O-acyltransferase n=1 Tax=Caulifigura coniformis TaxID=2527983 RepID=A0A517SKU7_9PLAN|nr:acyl-ACP--UDP-N-acetylglucosamine O-acyltransferase [Caulifigura coniformis]QDT56753.1 Acyl-[acyl-carrier-protein]--UDP-N-acetylglucosamine O-acyltransferase [Caulifigura coniformis]